MRPNRAITQGLDGPLPSAAPSDIKAGRPGPPTVILDRWQKGEDFTQRTAGQPVVQEFNPGGIILELGHNGAVGRHPKLGPIVLHGLPDILKPMRDDGFSIKGGLKKRGNAVKVGLNPFGDGHG